MKKKGRGCMHDVRRTIRLEKTMERTMESDKMMWVRINK